MNTDVSLTRDQAREIDRMAMEEYGVRGLILMENAGHECTRVAENMIESADDPHVSIFCGGGNNGGDGFVVARHLWNHGVEVQIYLVGDAEDVLEKGTDASVNLEIAQKMDLPIAEISNEDEARACGRQAADSDLVVDALLGTGITGDVRGPFAPLIETLNELPTPLMAVDMPSGLDCDTGEVLGVAARADATVTFVLKKRGQCRPGADEYVGELHVAEISVPRQLIKDRLEEWKQKGQLT